MKKIIIILSLVMLFIPLIGPLHSVALAVCGNGICEAGEEVKALCPTTNCEGSNCPPCQMICEQDCLTSTIPLQQIFQEIIDQVEVDGSGLNIDKVDVNADNPQVYLVTASRQVKLFFFIPLNMEVKMQINASTKEVISIKKPWWSFLTY